MAKLSNINGKFAVEDTGAIRFSDQTGTTGQILKSNGNSAPTWVDPNTVGTGPWLPLAGGVVSGATTFQSSLTVGGTLTVNGSGGSVFNSTGASNHIIAAYRASNGNNVATFRTTDSGYIFRIHAQNAGTIYIQNDDGSNYLKIPDNGNNEVLGNTTFGGNVAIGPDALDIQIKAASNNSGNNLIYMRGNASNDKSSLQMNHFGYADYYIGVGHVGNGKFNIANDLTGNDFVIDTSGNVGIGTTSPSDYYADQLVVKCSSSENGITIVSNSTTDANYLMFADGTSGADRYRGQVKYNHQDNYMSFATDATERMRITSAGNVNIATPITNAFYGLSLQYNATDTAEFKVNQATGQIKIGGVATGYFPTFYSAGSERMRIDSSGNINIGTGAASDTYVRIYNASSGDITAGYQVYNGSNLDLNIYTNPLFGNSTFFSRETFSFNTSAGAKVKILNNGNVGIGVTDPDAKLEIKASGSTTGLTFKTTDAAGNENFFIQDGGRTGVRYYPLTVGQASGTAAASGARFQVATTGGDFVVMNDGKTGIGTTSPNAKLDIGDGDFKQLKIIGANRLCVFRFQNAQSSFNNPDIVLFSNTTATGSYPQVSVHIKMHGRGFSANYSQFTEALATVELSTALIGLRSSIINHTTLGSAVSAGTFSISGTSLRFTPNRQTNYDTFSIEVNINSISVTYNT